MSDFDPTKHLTTTREVRDGVTIFNLEGECDMHTAPYVRLEISPALHKGGRVVINLQQVTFMDSAGYGMLVGLARMAQDQGGRLAVATSTTGIVLTGMKVLQVDKALPVTSSIEEAINLAKGDGPALASSV